MFEQTLEEMIGRVPQAIGGMFLDQGGEAVAISGPGIPKYDLQVIGAYKGIYLDRIRTVCRNLSLGSPQRFKVDWENSTLLTLVLNDGYYLVLVLQSGSSEGIAWHEMTKCGQILNAEI